MSVSVTEQRLLIGGGWVVGSGGSFEVRNPFTAEVASVAAAATRDDARRAVEAAAAAFADWSETPISKRRELLDRAAQLMHERAPEFAQVVADETGGTFGWGMFNVGLASAMLREAGVHAAAVQDTEIHSHISGKRMRAVRQPAGVVVGIAPWNAPVILGTRALAAPLAYGNTVVMKASEVSPRTHGLIVECLVQAGLPAGVVNLVTNAPADAADVVEELIAHPAVRRVNFTGSSHVGRIIAEQAGRHLKRVVLELGGKAPFVVLEDADLDAAAAAANFGAFMHQGQICMSTERIVVDRRVADEFAQKLVARASSLKVGDPRDPSTQIGPLINAGALDRVSELVEDALGKGAELLTGGEAEGLVYQPTVLRGVTPEMRIYSEESFGPSVSLVEVDGVEEAISVANDTEYGLSAAIFSRDVERAEQLARRIQSGICHINDATVHDEPQVPFGGVKASGWGRFGGQWAAEEFTELRWITIQDEQREYPI
ncbi:MAG: aldehyde dehydrogenase [Acidobacteriota bacterium]|nr:aldehyde dehydrogenase [Acidobacteriota bacterium]